MKVLKKFRDHSNQNGHFESSSTFNILSKVRLFRRSHEPKSIMIGLITFLYIVAGASTVASAQSYNTFSGTLTDIAGNPVQQSVALLDSNYNLAGVSTPDANGNFSMTVAPGVYKLYVFGTGLDGMSSLILLQNSFSIDLSGGDVSQNLQIPTVSVRVKVLDSNGNPLSGVSVYSQSANGNGGTTALFPGDSGENIIRANTSNITTDANGAAILTSVVGAIYGTDSQNSICAMIASGNVCLTSSVTLSDNANVTIQQPAQNTFSGTLTDNAGHPVQQTVAIYDSNYNPVGVSIPDTNGNFSIAAAPGLYKLRIYGTSLGGMNNLNMWQSGYLVDLSNGSVSQNLQIKTVAVHVTVLDSNNNPLSGVSVFSQSANGNGGTTSLYPNDPGETIYQANTYVVTTDGSGAATITSLVGATYGTDSQNSICAVISGSNVCLASAVTLIGDTNLVIRVQSPTPAIPTNLTGPTPAMLPVLSWTASTGATSYNIYRNGTKIGTTTTTTYTDNSTLTNGSNYSYYVTAANSSGESSSSNAITVTVDKTRPVIAFTAPSSLSGTFTTGPIVTITSTDASGLQSMAIHVYTSANVLLNTCGSATTAQLSAGTMSCSLASLANGSYFIKAGAFDKAGNNDTIVSSNFTISQ